MGEKRPIPAELQMLSRWQQDSVRLRVVLVTGVVLEGTLAGFDQYMLLLENSGMRAVYKHAIQSIDAGSGRAGLRPPTPGGVSVRVRKRRVAGVPTDVQTPAGERRR